MKYVVKENNRLFVKGYISSANTEPPGSIGKLPADILPEDYQYIAADPILDSSDSTIILGYNIYIDESVKQADASNRQSKKESEALRQLRARRNILLQETDFTQLLDSPLSLAQKQKFLTYRQALRDLPETVDSIFNPTFPTKPEV